MIHPTQNTSISPQVIVEYGAPLLDPAWDETISRSPGTSFFHSAGWARVLADSYGFRPVYLLTKSAGAIRTLLPIMEVNSWLTGRRGVSLPFSDECEPLWSDLGELRAVTERAVLEAASCGWKYLEFRSAVPSFPDAPASESYFRHHLDLRPGADLLLATMGGNSRGAIRKAEKSGVEVIFGADLADVREFYSLHCQTRKRLGVPPQPWTFFRHIHQHIIAVGNGIVAFACLGETRIAGAVFFNHGSTAIYKFAASSDAHRLHRGNNLVLWRAIQRFVDQGFDRLDLGRTAMSNDGLRRFKLSWGCSEEMLTYITYHVQTRQFAGPSARGRERQSRWITMLPMAVARAIGVVLYKHVA